MEQFLSSSGGNRMALNCALIKIQPVYLHLSLLLMDEIYFHYLGLIYLKFQKPVSIKRLCFRNHM